MPPPPYGMDLFGPRAPPNRTVPEQRCAKSSGKPPRLKKLPFDAVLRYNGPSASFSLPYYFQPLRAYFSKVAIGKTGRALSKNCNKKAVIYGLLPADSQRKRPSAAGLLEGHFKRVTGDGCKRRLHIFADDKRLQLRQQQDRRKVLNGAPGNIQIGQFGMVLNAAQAR